MKEKLIRITLTGEAEEVEFENEASVFMVKNFTSGDIYVSFEEITDTDECIKIPAGMFQACGINENQYFQERMTNKIFVSGTGEVEIQEIWFK